MAEGAPLLREYRAKHLIEGSNPSLSARYAKCPLAGRFVYLAERGVDEPSRVRQIRPERIWTAAGWPRSAPARRGLAHGWAKQSLADYTQLRSFIEAAFCVSGGERGVDEPSGDSAHPAPRPSGQRLCRCSLRHPATASDKIVWNEFGQPKAGPGARSAQGFGPWMGQTIPRGPTQNHASPSKRRFAHLAGERCRRTLRFDNFVLNKIGQPGRPAARRGLDPWMAQTIPR